MSDNAMTTAAGAVPIEPPAPGEVKVCVLLGEGAELSSEAQAALDQL